MHYRRSQQILKSWMSRSVNSCKMTWFWLRRLPGGREVARVGEVVGWSGTKVGRMCLAGEGRKRSVWRESRQAMLTTDKLIHTFLSSHCITALYGLYYSQCLSTEIECRVASPTARNSSSTFSP